LRPNGIFGPGENSAFKKAVDPAYMLGVLPFYFDRTQQTDWTSVYNLVFAHVLATHKLKTDPSTVGGQAYFITDDEVTNNAAWEIFRPAIEAAAGRGFEMCFLVILRERLEFVIPYVSVIMHYSYNLYYVLFVDDSKFRAFANYVVCGFW
jgi:nucleoside-diphosphate-sugar epimerase